MKKNIFFEFKSLRKQNKITTGVFGKGFGNVSFKYGNKKEVLGNRKEIAKTLKSTIGNIYEMDQVHGSDIRVLESKGLRVLENNVVPKVDGLISNVKNIFLMIKTADCFPVIFFDPSKRVTAAVHVGWRGAIEKIFLTTLLKMINFFDCQATDILVGIGPGIGPCCFRHKNLIQSKLPEWKNFIKEEKNGWQSVDIKNFIKSQLEETGIKKENIEAIDICTSCSKEFFSHFRSLQNGEPEGRFATIIGMRINL